MFYERYHIDNRKGRFYIQVAMDWGYRGGVPASEFLDIAKTAWPHILKRKLPFDFEYEPEAQRALAIFRQEILDYWISLHRAAYEKRPAFEQADLEGRIDWAMRYRR